MVDWVIRTKAQGEQFDNSKSAEKFKWFSVILEFIQNAIDSNLLFNRLKKLWYTDIKSKGKFISRVLNEDGYEFPNKENINGHTFIKMCI